jgi:MYXO-CTERM domain-containing protein
MNISLGPLAEPHPFYENSSAYDGIVMRPTFITAATAAALLGAPALAQTTATTADPAMMSEPVEENNEFPWGLLGLLGLAGLLGRKRDDRADTTRRAV